MEISDVRVKLIQDSGDRLKAVCSITLDGDFVVRDLKVVEGTNGLFVAMPSRKLSVHCPQCKAKNHLRARYCNECGAKVPPNRVPADANGRARLHRDIAHPINPAFRESVQSKVIEKFRAEVELAKSPDYSPTDPDHDDYEVHHELETEFAPTEYDELIAGLKSGSQEGPAERSRPRPAPMTPRPPSRPQAPMRPAPEARTAPRDQRGAAQRGPQKPHPQQGPRPGRGDSPRGGPRPADAPATVRADVDSAERRETRSRPRPAETFGRVSAPRSAMPTAPGLDEIPQPAAAPEEPKQGTASEADDVPFGMGIL